MGCGQLEVVDEQPGGPVTTPLGKVLHVPKPERSLIFERQASLMSVLLFVKRFTVAHLGTGKDVCCYISYTPSSGLYEMMKTRRKATPGHTLAARAPPQRDIIEVQRLLAHPSELTRATTMAARIIITGE